MRCGEYGHWYQDAACPLNQRANTANIAVGESLSTASIARPNYVTRELCHFVTMENHVANVATTSVDGTEPPVPVGDTSGSEDSSPWQYLAAVPSSDQPDQDERDDAYPKGRRLDKDRMELDNQVSKSSENASDMSIISKVMKDTCEALGASASS